MDHLSRADFDFLRKFFYTRTGIDYSDNKLSLIESRLSHFLQPIGTYKTFEALVSAIRLQTEPELIPRVIDKLSTHFSYFFREPIHFSFLQNRLLGKWQSRDQIRILSAACASGQEAWSAALCVAGAREIQSRYGDGRQGHMPEVHIDGIDVAPESVEKAQKGVYHGQELIPFVTPNVVKKYFDTRGPDEYRVKDMVRPLCSFRVMNILETGQVSGGLYDLVFMRNVLMYFQSREKEDLLDHVHRLLKPDGYLIISLSESLANLHTRFRHRRHSIFTLK